LDDHLRKRRQLPRKSCALESMMNLHDLSLPELKKLLKDVTAAITGFEARKKAEARAKLEETARELGFNLHELLGSEVATKRTRAPVDAKYRNPQNHDETWSGRGRRPAWFLAAVAAGTAPEDLAI
jgi:DNA-binding protein H-NS